SVVTADEYYERVERGRYSGVPQEPWKGRRQLRGRTLTTDQSYWRPNPEDSDQPGNVSQGRRPLPGLRVEGWSRHSSRLVPQPQDSSRCEDRGRDGTERRTRGGK